MPESDQGGKGRRCGDFTETKKRERWGKGFNMERGRRGVLLLVSSRREKCNTTGLEVISREEL